jgi:hypothetical protein
MPMVIYNRLKEATDEELLAGLDDKKLSHIHEDITAEAKRRVEERRRTRDAAIPFNPKIDISADARYLWKNFFIWFWLVPALACVLWLIVVHFG